jgi:hypothetical protein
MKKPGTFKLGIQYAKAESGSYLGGTTLGLIQQPFLTTARIKM